MHAAWKRFRYRLEWLGLSLAAKIIPLLSRQACFRLAMFAGAVTSILDRRGRAVALANLECAFGNRFSTSERQQIVRGSYQQFARTMIDLLWSPRLNRENWSRFIELANFEELVRAAEPERSVMVVCYHYSNFEWLSLACGYLDFAGTIISQEFKNSLLDPIFKKLREQSGHELIPRERGILRLYKVLRRKGRTALLVDLSVPPIQGAVVIDSFALKTSVTSAHAWLHRQTGVPVVPAHCEPLPRGRYRVVFHHALESSETATDHEIAQACWDSFEPYLRRNPAPWLWMYKQWRYKPDRADRPYPFYAQTWRKFDELIEQNARH